MKRRYVVFGLSAVLAISLAVPALGGPGNPVATVSKGAKKIAKEALNAANKAQQDATAAQQTANQAQQAASAAQTSANNALNQAQAANTAAQNAQATADSKVDGLEQIIGPGSATNSTNKADVASCSAGKEVTGGGYFTGGAGSNDVTATFNGFFYNDGWIASMAEIGAGTADTWSVTAEAVCASDPS
jgi:hypothetical protein